MNSIFRLAAVCLACAIVLAHPAPAAAAQTLPDSTVLDRWTLGNGLQVVTRHIPLATQVAVTIGYRGGSRQDPAGQEGLAALLAEAAYMGPADVIPERTRAEMPGLRPAGWNLRTSSDYVLLSELAQVAQFPGVLHQVALRMRSVTVTEDGLRTSRATVHRDLEERYSRKFDLALASQIRELALGGSQESIERRAAAKGIDALTAKQVQELIRARFVPANGVLCIVGNLKGIDLHRVIESEFGAIPAGTRQPDASHPPRVPGVHTRAIPGIQDPINAVGLIAPALTDSLHPSFYLHVLQLGTLTRKTWNPPPAPMSTTFEYSVVDEPDLSIFYPPEWDQANAESGPFQSIVTAVPPQRIEQETVGLLGKAIGWLLGGPIPDDMLKRIKTQPGPLYTLSSSTTAREIRGGEEFWSDYRRRLESATVPGPEYWIPYFLDASHRVELRLIPKR